MTRPPPPSSSSPFAVDAQPQVSKKMRRTNKGDLHGNDSIDWDSLSDELKSNLSKSVASLALYNGDKVLFACSGIAIESQENLTRFLTSATLAKAFINDDKRKIHNLKIKVRHEGSEVYEGVLSEYDLSRNFAIVTVSTFLDVHVGLLKDRVEILPCGMVLALGRGISGKLVPTNVTLTSEEYNASLWQISEVWEGGPLFTVDGSFVGMNLFLGTVRAYFVSWGSILNWLNTSQKKTKVARFESRPTCDKLNGHSEVHRPIHKGDMTSEYCKDLESLGYPIPEIDMGDDGVMLVNSFEEPFGDAYREGVWDELSKSVSSNIYRYVVALASFKGGKRHFACTGFFIEWNGSTIVLTSASLVRSSIDENKTDENLKIEVCLPNRRRIEGLLEHCNLHYNVALVGVRDCRIVRPASIRPNWFGCSKVASVGRSFVSGALMATSGHLVSWSGTLDCPCIVRSSCKITKAGIGGPLVNMLDGKVIGMNFYDKRVGTPFLLWKDIEKILAHFTAKSLAREVGPDDYDPSRARFWKMDGDNSDRPSRWPVPEPCWLRPDDLVEDKSEDDEWGIELPSGRRKRYGYLGGKKVVLF